MFNGEMHINTTTPLLFIFQNYDHINVYYVDTKKKYSFPFKVNLMSSVPEHQFYKMTLRNNILTLFMRIMKAKKRMLVLN